MDNKVEREIFCITGEGFGETKGDLWGFWLELSWCVKIEPKGFRAGYYWGVVLLRSSWLCFGPIGQ